MDSYPLPLFASLTSACGASRVTRLSTPSADGRHRYMALSARERALSSHPTLSCEIVSPKSLNISYNFASRRERLTERDYPNAAAAIILGPLCRRDIIA